MKKIINKEISREEKLFKQTPIWKSLLIIAFPGIILTLVYGSYWFLDSVISINFATDSYQNGILSAKDQVRFFMAGSGPITAFILAFCFLFATGISTRVSINLGARNKKRAINTIKTGMMISLITALCIMIILFFISKSWIAAQFPTATRKIVSDGSFKYVVPIIIYTPFLMFNQIASALLRVEGRNRQMLISNLTPVFFNLFLDWLFMGPIGMGVEGGGFATLIAGVLTTALFSFFIFKTSKSIIKFKNFFGFKFKIIAIFGILLVGLSPFLINISSSITETIQMKITKDVSSIVYKNQWNSNNFMTIAWTGILPVYSLFAQVVTAFATAARPIAAYNYGSKNYHRVKVTYWWALIYSLIISTLVYIFASFVFLDILMDILKVDPGAYIASKKVFRIIMLSLVLYSFAITGKAIFTSTDRVTLSFLAAILKEWILFLPIMFLMQAIAINNVDYKYWFWWFLPIINALSSIIITITISFTISRINKRPQFTLDDRINKINNWITKKIKK